MKILKTQTISEFYDFKFNRIMSGLVRETGHFNVFCTEGHDSPENKTIPYRRRDFYKISLIRGEHIFHYADKSLKISGTTLMFFNPQVPYTLESLAEIRSGFFCIFSKSFFPEDMRLRLDRLPMYALGGKPAYELNEQQDALASEIYSKMLAEKASDYVFKEELLRSYITELTHLALKSQPSEYLYQHPNSKSRITAVFTELLERQFPVGDVGENFTMRSPGDFADSLSVHVNHLNRAVKETTGKTTSDLISERRAAEAKMMLRYTDWNISEIGYRLGFAHPAHFNNFFRKHAKCSPSAFRAN